MRVLEVFEETKKDKILEEGIIPITPFLAFASFKKNTFGRVKDKMIDLKQKVGNFSKRTKAKVRIEREKIRSDIGLTTGKGDGATVYKLTKEQMDVMSDVYRKYGRQITKDIMLFRRNVLAPYSLIKRKIKESSRVTNKDKFGMSKAEFKAYLESGRKKIESRGEKFEEKSEELRDRISRINDQLGDLESALDILKTKEEIPKSILSRLYLKYNVHDKDFDGYSADDLRKKYNEFHRNIEDKIEEIKDGKRPSKGEVEAVFKGVAKEGEGKKGNMNIALARYTFRREILDQLRDEKPNIFKESYELIVTEMIDALVDQKGIAIRKLRSFNSSTELNDKESKIWKVRSSASKYSNDLNDYYQIVKEEDFLDAPIYIERSQELKDAEQQIENEIRRFERSLQKKISPEDYKRLKDLRVINNLISIREIMSSDELFKSSSEIANDRGDVGEVVTPEDFEKTIRRIDGMTFSSIAELNNHKKRVKSMVDKMESQGDSDQVRRLSSLIDRIDKRRSLSPFGGEVGPTFKNQFFDINDIQEFAQDIINKKYSDMYSIRYDKQRLESMIKKFGEDNSNADSELGSIKFILDRVDNKLTRGI